MKTNTKFLSGRGSAFTALELLVVILIVLVMVGLFLPMPSSSKPKAIRIQCASDLKQLGLAFRIWEGDNGDRYPMQVYTNTLGFPEFTDSANLFRYLQVMSNEINNPKILICPADKSRTQATNFTSDFNSSHLSYFIALDADETHPQLFLSGDSNITNGMPLKNGLMEITTNQTLAWTKDRHNLAGNVGLADGSVQQFSSSALQTAMQHTGFVTNRLLFP